MKIRTRKNLARGLKVGGATGLGLLLLRIGIERRMGIVAPEPARHLMKGLGGAGMIYGAASPNKNAGTIGGIGLGSVIGSIDTSWAVKKLAGGLNADGPMYERALGPDAIDMEVYDIPEWMGRQYGYEKVSYLLKKYVLEDTYNKKTGEMIPAGYKHPSVVWLTRNILAERGASVYDPIAVADAISDWCWNNLTYVYDPMTSEAEDYFVHPYLLIKDYTERGFAAGDCDDFAVLVASMLLSVGLTPRFLLWAQNAEAPQAYTHITTALYTPDYKYPDLKNMYDGWPYYNIEATMKVDTGNVGTMGIPGATPGGYNYHPRTYKRGVIVITE